ncbi:hypothetical protein [Actimicrobium sp. CCI2.3]|uniref:hypothetical protein n=1 Tax=Actimicrobium sp. CCI2.3 TaxID=3048616 RepID=UPI002AB502E7|nr:hypothetical protein [Actimicrobium sp. CCI2.3]MDY7576188.1 hypothetical protein [Actimicrobium sp. CCI2.3]MEB0020607.1 hypothetical protein [Actimicrobium sp. CCI2.3]
MKTTDSIYPRLKPSTAAIIVWGLMKDDPQEAKKIATTVMYESRIVPVIEFGETIIWLQSITQYWGVFHWRLMCDHVRAMAALTLSSSDADHISGLCALRLAEARLIACDEALDDAAANFGFDAQTARELATASRFTPIVPETKSDDATKIEISTMIAGAAGTGPTGCGM